MRLIKTKVVSAIRTHLFFFFVRLVCDMEGLFHQQAIDSFRDFMDKTKHVLHGKMG